jgi:hypothetical protein
VFFVRRLCAQSFKAKPEATFHTVVAVLNLTAEYFYITTVSSAQR